MKIAVISDTHMPKRGKQLPQELVSILIDVDLIIHAGDWQTLDLYEKLTTYAPVEGVIGNVDDEMSNMLSERLILSFKGINIGIVHGHGKSKTTEKRAMEAFEYEEVDIIIFGHSHIPVLKEYDGLLLFNPGSPTDKRRQPLFSFGILHIHPDYVRLEHIFYKDKS